MCLNIHSTTIEHPDHQVSSSPAFTRLWCVSLQPPAKGVQPGPTKGIHLHQPATDRTPYLFPPDSPPSRSTTEAPFLSNGIGKKPLSPLRLAPFPPPHVVVRPSLMLVTVLAIALALWLVALGLLILGVFSSDTSLPPSPRPTVPRLLNSSHMEEVILNLEYFFTRSGKIIFLKYSLIYTFSLDCSMLLFLQMLDGNLVSYVSTKFKAPATDEQRSIFYRGETKKINYNGQLKQQN